MRPLDHCEPVPPERTAIVVQARTGSTRLPGKVLLPLGNRTVLEQVVHRCRRITRAGIVCVATTELEADDAIVEVAARAGATVHRGSETDVLMRTLDAARTVGADLVVRITSDCPLLDPGLVDAMLARRLGLARAGAAADYYANTLVRTFPRGLDTEIVPTRVLARVADEATDARAREHVTWHVYTHAGDFALVEHVEDDRADRSAMRWTLDTPQDLEFLRAVYAELGDDCFDRRDVYALLRRRPELGAINADVRQKDVASTSAERAPSGAPQTEQENG